MINLDALKQELSVSAIESIRKRKLAEEGNPMNLTAYDVERIKQAVLNLPTYHAETAFELAKAVSWLNDITALTDSKRCAELAAASVASSIPSADRATRLASECLEKSQNPNRLQSE